MHPPPSAAARTEAHWAATERYQLACGPGGLPLVQELVNTSSAGRPRRPDLLSDQGSAQRWADDALRSWALVHGRVHEPISLTDHDVDELRTLRDDLRSILTHPGHAPDSPTRLRSLAIGIALDSHGTTTLQPRGDGWRRIASAILIEIHHARRADLWRRVKICRNERCAVAFYDRSKNNSGVWHDVRTCGNVANLRASRARRKHSGPTPPTPG